MFFLLLTSHLLCSAYIYQISLIFFCFFWGDHDFVIRRFSFSHFIIFRWFVVSEVIVCQCLLCYCYCCCLTYLTLITFTNKCSTANANWQKQQAVVANATSLTDYCSKYNSNNNNSSSGNRKIKENQTKLTSHWNAHKSQAAYEICSKHNEADSTGATSTPAPTHPQQQQ